MSADRTPVLLTRSAEDCASWEQELGAAGIESMSLPCITSLPSDDPGLAAELAAGLEHADWLVVTSRRGVDALTSLGIVSVPASTRVAAVGPATAERARDAFGRADLVGPGTAAALAQTLAELIGDGDRCLLALAANAGNVLAAHLRAAGAHCTRIDVYRTMPMPLSSSKQSLSALGASRILFASPTAVTGFVNQVDVDCDYKAFSIGPATSAAICDTGLRVTAEAREPKLTAIIDLLGDSMHV